MTGISMPGTAAGSSHSLSMPDLDPALAKKVLEAEVRNLVKKVGDGGTLSSTDRQVFLSFTEGNASADEIREARIGSLLRKWMDGGRLSGSERDEIAHIMPDAIAVNTEAAPLPDRPGSLIRQEIESIYGISRAKYFRWMQDGNAVPEGPDLPPFDDPKGMVAWYERMKLRGIFKKKCPKILADLAIKGLPARETLKPAPVAAPVAASRPAVGGITYIPRDVPEERGFLVEHEKLEVHTARLREDYLKAYEEGDTEKGNLLKAMYFEAYELLRKSAAQKGPITMAEGSQVKVADVEEDLSSIIPAMVGNLISPQHIRALYDELQLEKCGIGFAAFQTAHRRQTILCFEVIKKSRFAPPFHFDADAAA